MVAQLANIVANLAVRIDSTPLHLDGLVRAPGALVTKETGESEGRSKAWEASVLEGLETAFDGLVSMRERGGARLGALLGDQLKTLARLCDVVEKSAAAQP